MSIAEPQDAIARSGPVVWQVVPQRRVTRYERFAKPALDRLLAGAMLVLLAPVMLVTALVLLSRLGAPVFIRQSRVGLGGRRFSMLKFRTMHACRRQGPSSFGGPDRRVRHKSPDDPRLDPVGRFVRAASLDELPQLVNVLRGDMSVVGPRPEMVEIVEGKYEPWQHQRHAVKPGLTGLWQVTARADTDTLMHEVTDIDLLYTQQVSFRADALILLRTIPALVKQRGF